MRYVDRERNDIWQEEWIVYLLDIWQSGETGEIIAEEMKFKFKRNFTRNQVLGMIGRLRKKFGSEDVDGPRALLKA